MRAWRGSVRERVTTRRNSWAVIAAIVGVAVAISAAPGLPVVAAPHLAVVGGSVIDPRWVERLEHPLLEPDEGCQSYDYEMTEVSRTFHCETVSFTFDPAVRITLPPAPMGRFTVRLFTGKEVAFRVLTKDGGHVLGRGDYVIDPRIDCGEYNLTHAVREGCRIELRNPYPLSGAMDINLDIAYEENAEIVRCKVDAPIGPPATIRTARRPMPVADSTAAKVGDPWETDFVGPFGFDEACVRAEQLGSPILVVSMAAQQEHDRWYVLRPEVDGFLTLPYIDGQRVRVLRRINPHRQFWGQMFFEGTEVPFRLSQVNVGFMMTARRSLWLDRSAFGSRDTQAGFDVPPTATTGRAVTWENSCDAEHVSCVYSIGGGPNQSGDIPLTPASVCPEDYPNVTISVPQTPTKYLAVTAPPYDQNLVSVTVTTEDVQHTLHSYIIAAGRMFVAPTKERVIALANNTR